MSEKWEKLKKEHPEVEQILDYLASAPLEEYEKARAILAKEGNDILVKIIDEIITLKRNQTPKYWI